VNPVELLILGAARELVEGEREWWRWYSRDAGPVWLAAFDVIGVHPVDGAIDGILCAIESL